MSPFDAKHDGLEVVRAYHERTKHQLQQYAKGPETLDWDAQPAPFRRFVGAEAVPLPGLGAADPELRGALERRLGERNAAAPLALSLAALGALFALSLGITAWKQQGPDRWAVRANPSSGNLHPIEGYLLVAGVGFLQPGVYHYRAEDHSLEQRALWSGTPDGAPRVCVALTSIIWREAWKYGERAFRYCQLDTGHAMAAVSYAAALFGWRARERLQVGSETLRLVLGLNREQDFARVRRPETEHEEPEVLLELTPELGDGSRPDLNAQELRRLAMGARFFGQASPIDQHPMYSWPVVKEVALATRSPDEPAHAAEPQNAHSPLPLIRSQHAQASVANLILGRRSAQRFDGRFVLAREAFAELLNAAASSAVARNSLDLLLFVHRVETLTPGVYLLPRSHGEPARSLIGRLAPRFELRPVAGFEAPALFEVSVLAPQELARTARTLHCHQDIAANCCFALGMLADLEQTLHSGLDYRRLLREAGSLGQTLYLHAEALGVRGTGIGCFFDDAVAEEIGLGRSSVRSVYHFSIGKPVDDPRIQTSPAPLGLGEAAS